MKHAVVTGAGSGVGRAVALRLAQAGWRVAAIGRGQEALEATAGLAPPGAILVERCDVTDEADVRRSRDRIGGAWVTVDALINAAGTNVAKRAIDHLSVADFRRLIEVNLIGAFHVAHAFLPLMHG